LNTSRISKSNPRTCAITRALRDGLSGAIYAMRFLAVLITVLLLIVGGKLCLTGDKMYDEAQVYPAAEHVDYQKFGKERPLVGWYQISGGIADLTEGAYRSAQVNGSPEFKPTPNDLALLNRAKEIYVPVHDASGLTTPADIILYTRDPDLLNAVKSAADGPETSIHITAPRVIKGMVRTPSELPDRIRRVLGDSITTQSIIVEEYAEPSAARAIGTMAAGGGLLLCTALLWLFIWKRDRKPVLIPEEYMPDALLLDEDV